MTQYRRDKSFYDALKILEIFKSDPWLSLYNISIDLKTQSGIIPLAGVGNGDLKRLKINIEIEQGNYPD
jgi:hypothetical protein